MEKFTASYSVSCKQFKPRQDKRRNAPKGAERKS